MLPLTLSRRLPLPRYRLSRALPPRSPLFHLLRPLRPHRPPSRRPTRSPTTSPPTNPAALPPPPAKRNHWRHQLLLTIPESVGYEQKPLSLYYCYDDDQILKKCIAEDMLGNWSIKANAPDDVLSVSISVQHPELGNYFTATLKAKRVSSSSVSEHDVFFWLMPHKVVVWIYWHALKLWWKNVAFVQHPRSPTLHIGRTLWSV